ncbi:MAG: tetratricopeptide repeat protein [Thermoplasmata archaeon]|nr:tetratricopeptide repeat protein [Thermoplasmata archaeon]
MTPEHAAEEGEDGVGSLLERADSLYESRDYLQALSLYDEVMAKGTRTETLLNNRGAALDALGRAEEASLSYMSAVDLSPDYELAWHNLGASLYSQGRMEESAAAFSRALSLNRGRQENYRGLALAYIHLGARSKARDTIDMMTPLVSDPEGLLRQAQLYLDAGAAESAAKCARSFLQGREDDMRGWRLLGAAQHDMGSYYDAVRAFEHIVESSPSDADAWNSMGYSYFCAAHIDRALGCFDRAIEIAPFHKGAWYNKGYTLHGADRLAEAVECYRKAIAIDPNDKVLWNNLGNAQYNLGMFAESIPKFVSALEVDPDYEIAWNNIGNAFERMGMFAEAIPYHDRSLEIRPDFDYAMYAKGVCLAATGRPDEGYDLVVESLDLNPGYDDAWKARSRIAAQLGRLDEALLSIEEALEINPSYDEGWSDRGDILASIGDLDGARRSRERALECNGVNGLVTAAEVDAAHRRASVLERLGRYKEALDALTMIARAGKLSKSGAAAAVRLSGVLSLECIPDDVMGAIQASDWHDVKAMAAERLISCGMTDAARALAEGPKGEPEPPRSVLLRAEAASASGDVDGALAILGAISQDDTGHDVSSLRGELLEAKGDAEGAAEAYSLALERSPSDYRSALGLARVQMERRRYKDALRAATLASGISPGEPDPFMVMSIAYEAMGETKRAEAARRSMSRRRSHMLASVDEVDDEGKVG